MGLNFVASNVMALFVSVITRCITETLEFTKTSSHSPEF